MGPERFPLLGLGVGAGTGGRGTERPRFPPEGGEEVGSKGSASGSQAPLAVKIPKPRFRVLRKQ